MNKSNKLDLDYADRIKQVAVDFKTYELGELLIESTIVDMATGGNISLISNPDSKPVYRCGIRSSVDKNLHCFSEVVMNDEFDLVAAHLAALDVMKHCLHYRYKITQEERDEITRKNLAEIKEDSLV